MGTIVPPLMAILRTPVVLACMTLMLGGIICKLRKAVQLADKKGCEAAVLAPLKSSPEYKKEESAFGALIKCVKSTEAIEKCVAAAKPIAKLPVLMQLMVPF